MPFTPSSRLIGALALISQSFASPIASGTGASIPNPVPSATGTFSQYNSTNATYSNSTGVYPPTVTVWDNGAAPPPAYTVEPVPMASYTPGPVLQPAVHWDHPTNDMNQLLPTNESSLYYSSNGTADPTVEHMFASLNTTSQYQSVVLAHSSFVQSVSCAADGVLVTFTQKDAFEFAANAWPDHGEDFVLVTYTDGCGNSSDQRTFWLIDSLTYLNDTNAIDAKVIREIGIEDAFSDVHMVWGKYSPAATPAANATKRGLFDDIKGGLDSLNTGDKTVTKSADINLAAPTGDSSPWGGAALLFDMPGKVSVSNKTSDIDTEFKIFCVNCGVKSHFTLMGEAAWKIVPPTLTKLTAEIDANVVANFHLGLVATAEFSDTKQKQLFNQAIPDLGFSVGGVFDAGVYVTVDAVATIDITAEGQVLAGVTMTIPDFKATLDLKDGTNSKTTGLDPTWDKQFEVAGAIGAKATLALPVGLHLGIKIAKIFDKSIALVEQPSLSAQAQIAGGTGGSSVPGVTCNNGVSYSVDAHNDVTLNILDLKTFNIAHNDWNILSGCKQLDLPKTTTSSATLHSTTTAAATSVKTTADKPTGTGAPINSGNSTRPQTTGGLHPSGVPVHSGNSTIHSTGGMASGPKVTSRPGATGTHGSGPVYGSANATTVRGPTAASTKPAAITSEPAGPVYGGDKPSASTKPAAETTSKPAAEKTPGYGGDSPSSSTKPAAETTSKPTAQQTPNHGENKPSSSSKPAVDTTCTDEKPTSTSKPAAEKTPGYGGDKPETTPAAKTTSSSTTTTTTTTTSSSSTTTMKTTTKTSSHPKATPIVIGY